MILPNRRPRRWRRASARSKVPLPPKARQETARYRRFMTALWSVWRANVFASLRSQMRTDARDTLLSATFKQLFANVRLEDFLRRLAEDVDVRGATYVRRIVKIAPTPASREYEIADFVRQNVSLITKLGEEQAEKLELLFTNLAGSGVRHEAIAEQLEEMLDIGESRAKFIARDQTSKLNAQLLKSRHLAAGIVEYDWSSSRDNDVRDFHAALDGTRHRYDDPPVTDKYGNRNNPGEDHGCRCTAIPVIPTFDED